MSGPVLKILNLPWTMSRQDLVRFLSRTLNTRITYSRIHFDKNSGLSRGVATVQLENEQLAADVIRNGTLEVEGRNAIVVRADPRSEARLRNRNIDQY